ncbi:hypothetical protein [Luteolibacter luteus]|uniref:Uncharacterized protein n=1 Tax=Luteolibacter luteus TaxID=2728835 RepID=A0A858RKY6_9BACT|nr:hypothetical protein [Luteolibacter luteus]QJE97512.1 hypothetical protein HHL09_17545 [Luteolibacter luteus]
MNLFPIARYTRRRIALAMCCTTWCRPECIDAVIFRESMRADLSQLSGG